MEKVVGFYTVKNSSNEIRGVDSFIYDNGTFSKINGPTAESTLYALDINNSGTIIGSYQEERYRQSFVTSISSSPNFFTDADGDGYTVEGNFCGSIDCNDADPEINSGTKWYYDADNDGYGSYGKPVLMQCSKPDNYVLNNKDSDDNNIEIGSLDTPSLSEWGMILLTIAVVAGFYKRERQSISWAMSPLVVDKLFFLEIRQCGGALANF